eukprot:UN12499
MFMHNILLCLFSALTFYNTFPLISSLSLREGLNGALCDKKLEGLLSGGIQSIFGYWTYLFYLSKFYEFVDTFLMIARGKRPILLQT